MITYVAFVVLKMISREREREREISYSYYCYYC